MLLAVLGLADAGLLQVNRICFGPALLERYLQLFDSVKTATDHANPYFPFFHLQSDSFWHLVPLPGRESIVAAMRTARSTREITENIDCAALDEDLFQLLQNPLARDHLRNTLVAYWFPGEASAAVSRQLALDAQADRYERRLRGLTERKDLEEPAPEPSPARSTAFRRVITEAYDYRCAASGWRIVLPDNTIMVEAAHLIPFAESHDDSPGNGIALTPTYHWALDHLLIAPGPNHRWHVSKSLDTRIRDNAALLDLSGQPLLLPRDHRYWPTEQALRWRLDNLR
jgi:putative restriction endonuclease